jgi:hypothetical protein
MLKKLFTQAAIAHAIKTLPEIKSPVMDTFYPAASRTTHPFSMIGIDEISETVKAVPVVRRGTASISVGGGSRSQSYIEPQPIDVNSFAGAKDLNDLKLLDSAGQQTYVNAKIDFIRKTVRATSEALCAQSLSGKISYAMKTETGMDTYEVDFGTVATATIAEKWGADTTQLKHILTHLMDMAETIETAGFGSNVEFYAGKTAFSEVASKVIAMGNDTRIEAKVDGNVIKLGGYTITRMAATYYDPKAKTYKKAIDDKFVQAVGKDAAFGFKYLAIDDLDAGLQAMPIFINPKKVDDPSGWKIMGQSKPLPIPVVKAMVKAQVIA